MDTKQETGCTLEVQVPRRHSLQSVVTTVVLVTKAAVFFDYESDNGYRALSVPLRIPQPKKFGIISMGSCQVPRSRCLIIAKTCLTEPIV